MALQGSSLDYRPSGTNVTQDRDYWIRQLNSPNRAIREQAAIALEDLQKTSMFNARMADTQEGRNARLASDALKLQQGRDIHDETLTATIADRDVKNAIIQQNASTRRAEELQMAINDPNLPPEIREAAKVEYTNQLGLKPGAATATAAPKTKGDYGPGTKQEAKVPEKTTSTYTQPTAAFTEKPRGVPERPTPSNRYYQASRYPASEGFTPRDRARIAGNLDRLNAQDEQFNELAYKRDIGGENYARIYGTEMARPGQAPAADIPQLYAGTPTIPDISPVGYYDKAGNFLGPLSARRPAGATGIHGTAAVPGVTFDPNTGRTIAMTPEASRIIAGEVPISSSRPQGVKGLYDTGEYARATPEYKPPTEAFTGAPEKPTTAPAKTGGSNLSELGKTALKVQATGLAFPYSLMAAPFIFGGGSGGAPVAATNMAPAPTPAPLTTGGPQPNPTPGGTIAPSAVSALYNAPIVTPTPANTPPAMVHPQASNDRLDLLRDTEDTFYGGGHAQPVPTPTPTPGTQHLADAQRQEAQRIAELQRLAMEEARRRGIAGSNYSFA